MPPEQDPARRAVVTGLGAVMPIGNDFPTYWSNLIAGVTGTRLVRSFDTSAHEVQIAAEVLDFDPTTVMDAKMARRMSRFIQLAMGAGAEAVRDSGIDFAAMDQDQRDRVGVVVNTGGGGIEQIIDGTHVHDQKGPRFVSPFAVPALSGSMAACMLSMEYRLTGPVITQVAACATSVIAFHDALRLIRTGECDVVLTGGSEAPIWPMGLAALSNMTALSEAQRRSGDRLAAVRRHARRVRPRRGGRGRRRRSLAHALARGATPIAEVIGGALTSDAFHISAPDPSGRGQTRAMTSALRNAGIAPDEVDYIVAHGTATQLNDSTETKAIKAAYGDHAYKVAISSPKSMIGHLVGAAGIASALAAIGAIRDGVIPPTANLHSPDPECDLDYVPLTARRRRSRRSPSTASGSAARTRWRSSGRSPEGPALERLDRGHVLGQERDRPSSRVVEPDEHRFAGRHEARLGAGDARHEAMLERERRPADPGRPGVDRHDLAVERLGAIGDPGLSEDETLGRARPQGERLAGDVGPVPDARDLAVGQVFRVVDVTHRVGVGEPDRDLHLVVERAGQVAQVSRRGLRVWRLVHVPSVRAGVRRIRAAGAS